MNLLLKKSLLLSMLLALLLVLGGAAEAYAATSTYSKYTDTAYSHSTAHTNAVIINGIDVSAYQSNFNWVKAKADGIDFAIIRVGGRGYGSAGTLYTDEIYKKHIKEAQAAGVMVGVYFFSQALNEMEAWAEANYTLKLIKGYELDLPVFMDYEFAGGSAGRLNKNKRTKAQMTANARKFCETIEEAGYRAGVYANLNFLNKTIDGKALGKDYVIWAAQYYSQCQFTGTYDFWQYSSGGRVNGYSKRLDMDFWYLNETPVSTSSQSLANAYATISGPTSFDYSSGMLYEPPVSVTLDGRMLTRGTDYDVFYLRNAQLGTAYAYIKGKGAYTDYCLVPFAIRGTSSISGFTIDTIPNKYYTGVARKPSFITVRNANGEPLRAGIDYGYSTVNATNVGTATVTVTFKGQYSGTMKTTYKILAAAQTITADKTSYTADVADGSFNLTGIKASGGGVISYKSSNTAVAKVSGSGTVTPLKAGTATITVTAAATENYKSATKKITIKVTDKTASEPEIPPEPEKPVKPAQTITTEADAYALNQLSAVFNLDAKSSVGTALTYTSSNPDVAKVSTKGVVSLMGPGTAKITITAAETADYAKATKTVTVKVNKLSTVTYDKKVTMLTAGVKGTKVVTLKAEAQARKVKLTWKKSNSGYALDGYQIWRSTKKTSGYKKLFTNTTSKQYTNTAGLKPGKTYYYQVRGYRRLENKLVYTPYTRIQVKTPAK